MSPHPLFRLGFNLLIDTVKGALYINSIFELKRGLNRMLHNNLKNCRPIQIIFGSTTRLNSQPSLDFG